MTQHIDESITQSEGCKIFSQSRFIRLLHIGIEIRLPLSLDRGALHWAPYSIPGFLAGQMSCGHAIWRGYFCLCFPFRVGCWWLDTGGNGGATLGMSMREIERLLATICAHFLCDSWRFHRRGRRRTQGFCVKGCCWLLPAFHRYRGRTCRRRGGYQQRDGETVSATWEARRPAAVPPAGRQPRGRRPTRNAPKWPRRRIGYRASGLLPIFICIAASIEAIIPMGLNPGLSG